MEWVRLEVEGVHPLDDARVILEFLIHTRGRASGIETSQRAVGLATARDGKLLYRLSSSRSSAAPEPPQGFLAAEPTVAQDPGLSAAFDRGHVDHGRRRAGQLAPIDGEVDRADDLRIDVREPGRRGLARAVGGGLEDGA